MKYLALVIAAILFLGAAPINSGISLPLNGPCTPVDGPGICNDNGVLVSFDANGNKTPVVQPVVMAGHTATVNIVCPQGKGSITNPNGWSANGCTLTIVSIQ